jgi:hypothetical protein
MVSVGYGLIGADPVNLAECAAGGVMVIVTPRFRRAQQRTMPLSGPRQT